MAASKRFPCPSGLGRDKKSAGLSQKMGSYAAISPMFYRSILQRFMAEYLIEY